MNVEDLPSLLKPLKTEARRLINCSSINYHIPMVDLKEVTLKQVSKTLASLYGITIETRSPQEKQERNLIE